MPDRLSSGDLPDREQRPQELPGYSLREQHTIEGLRLLDPELAALYERGLRLTRELDQHGTTRLLAFIGRELSRGVLSRVLDDEGLAFSDEEFDELPTEDRNRAPIARALHLPREDPRVSDWFRLPRLFASWEKYANTPPPPEEVRAAYERLSALLYGRVAPYYATEADLDALLAVNEPRGEHAARLRDLQLRPGQRHYFFDRLQNPAWVPFLTAQGIFKSAPGQRQNADSSWSGTPWPEGNYLARVASEAPDAVVVAITAVPVDNDNPLVWDALARAAAGLPPNLAALVVPQLLKGLVSGSAWFAAKSVGEVAASLAAAGRAEAFEIASYLLYVVPPGEAGQLETLRYSANTDWVFPRLGWHDKSETMSRLVAALEASDPDRMLRLLLSKLGRVQELADAVGLNLWWNRNRAEQRGRRDRDDVVVLLVELTVQVAERIAARGTPDARAVLGLVDKFEGDFFRGVGYSVLARVGESVPERIDEFLASSVARDPDFPATEVAALLRTQFRNASEAARMTFADALSEVRELESHRAGLRRWYGREPTEAEVLDAARHSQRRVLMFFRGDIPEELRGLAEELGVWGVTPSHRDQQLAEVGSYSEAGSWGGPDLGGVSAEELALWSVDEILDLVSSSSGADRGLHGTLLSFARGNSGKALDILARFGERQAHPLALEGILNGLAEAVNAGEALDWRRAIAGIERLVRGVAKLKVSQTADRAAWRRTAGRAIRVVQDGSRKDAIPPELAPDIWGVLREAVAIPIVWEVADPARGQTVGDVIVAELNDATGDISNGVLSAALWHFRATVRVAGRSNDEAQAAVGRELIPILDRWLQDAGPHAAVARAVIGDYWPQVHLLVPEWVAHHSADLFDGGVENPASRPTWTTYVARSDLYDQVFLAARTWYRKAAEAPEAWEKAVGKSAGTREVTERLAVHLLIAVLRGVARIGDEDELLEIAFQNLAPADWSHAYWAVFRGWSDADDPVPPEFVERLVGLWEWRVSELSAGEPQAAVEEAKALGWLFHTPFIPVADTIRLGRETARLSNGQLEMYSRWDRMIDLAEADPDGTFPIAESVLYAQARADYPYVPVEDVRPFLEYVLKAGSPATQDRTRRLINQLGERGFRQLKDLLG